MMRAECKLFVGLLLLLVVLPAAVLAQGLTGQISGSVQDSEGAVVSGAQVSLVNNGTGQPRETTTRNDGTFVITDLLPGDYNLSIVMPGFKKFQQMEINLTATERVVLRPSRLELGELTQTVQVTAEAPRIQSQSAERSGLISSEEISELGLKGRDYMELLSLLPGVVDTASREAPGWNSLDGITVNGNREGSTNLTLDGVSSRDTGGGKGPYLAPGMDAIGEVKVQLSNYQAEYGRSSGGAINVVIKNGTKQWHGGGFFFLRNEALNANGFFYNRDGLARAPYRFMSPGFNVGGPILAPGRRWKDRMYFFWSEEWTPRRTPSRVGNLTMPTALERDGDFSRTLDLNGKLIAVNDPLNGKKPFPGNIIPRDRIDPAGQGLLKLFPMPNYVDPLRTYNTVFQRPIEHPRRDDVVRLDFNLDPKTVFYVRGIHDVEAFRGDFNFSLASNVWPQLGIDYSIRSRGIVATVIRTLSPSVVNEFTVGMNHAAQDVAPLSQETLDRNDRTKMGVNFTQVHPEINPYNLVPNATFGGVTNAPKFNIEARFPFRGRNTTWNVSDNLSKVWRTHTLKAGFYLDRTRRDAARASEFNGTISFNRSANANFDTNFAFSNAVLGSITSYTEADAHPHAYSRFRNIEWFVQDNWRVNRRLTFDVGVRFYSIVPTWVSGQKLAYFALEDYRPEKAPLLILPYRATPTSARVGFNPVTKEFVSEALIGTFVPGSGDMNNGMRVRDESIMQTPNIHVAPRIGFAWDPRGDGKTAVRGGFGIYPDRFSDDQILQMVEQPPLINTFAAYNTTIRSLLSTTLTQSPADVLSIQTKFRSPTSYNWSFGVQRDVGFKTSLDVAYVGNVGRHLLQRRQLNAFPYGTNFQGSAYDPSAPDIPLPANFLRPIRGYGDIGYIEFASSSNYHSMQTRVSRRFSRTFTFGSSWTWSKAMDLVDVNTGNLAYVNPFLDYRMRNYGKAGFDRTHNFSLNYMYRLPRFSRHWNNAFSRKAFDGWEASGVTRFLSGAPLGLNYSFVQSTDVTGTGGVAGVDSRVVLSGNPNLPKSERSVDRHFRTEVVSAPLKADFGIGNASKDPIRGPGINNFDISIFKNTYLTEDGKHRLQFRLEMYNAFNHTQFNAVDTTARFDAQGNNINGRFGQYTAARDARRIQAGLKYIF
jgi:hypothetical protein